MLKKRYVSCLVSLPRATQYGISPLPTLYILLRLTRVGTYYCARFNSDRYAIILRTVQANLHSVLSLTPISVILLAHAKLLIIYLPVPSCKLAPRMDAREPQSSPSIPQPGVILWQTLLDRGSFSPASREQLCGVSPSTSRPNQGSTPP